MLAFDQVQEFACAGAEIIETNTFGANRYRLAEHGLEHNVRALNRAGAKVAREARELSARQAKLQPSWDWKFSRKCLIHFTPLFKEPIS